MSDIAIRVESLGKSYMVGHNAAQREAYKSLRDVFAREIRSLARKTRDMMHGRPIVQGDEIEEFWALRDVSFEIRAGETVGIVGGNGAGKSTLLKILSRVTAPTRGRITVNGRVASLLEVGTGFHSELSGRENIFLNAAILGMSRREIHRKFDEIVAFAGVSNFIDTPVKRYSSGMYVRLAFAVAAHLDPEILVIDEVLAVGDAAFQRKCLGKIGEIGASGRTILFVSHSTGAIRNLCTCAVLLSKGSVQCQGDVPTVLDTYLRTGAGPNAVQEWSDHDMPGDLAVRIQRLSVLQESNRGGILAADEPIIVSLELICRDRLAEFDLSLLINDANGTEVIHTTWSVTKPDRSMDAGRWCVRYQVPPHVLKSGRYSLSISGMNPGVSFYFRLIHAVGFEVGPMQSSFAPFVDSSWRGILSPQLGSWTAALLPPN